MDWSKLPKWNVFDSQDEHSEQMFTESLALKSLPTIRLKFPGLGNEEAMEHKFRRITEAKDTQQMYNRVYESLQVLNKTNQFNNIAISFKKVPATQK